MFHFQADGRYRSWRAIDDEFLRKLREVVAHPIFDPIRNDIDGIGYGESLRTTYRLSGTLPVAIKAVASGLKLYRGTLRD